MQQAPERFLRTDEADAARILAAAIREHRRNKRPSLRSEDDEELYRALTLAETPGVVFPPEGYREVEERYYDSPY